jgi:hypothetical protein
MSTARVLNFPLFSNAVLEDVFEGGLEGMVGALISVLALRSFKVWLAAVSSIRIERR